LRPCRHELFDGATAADPGEDKGGEQGRDREIADQPEQWAPGALRFDPVRGGTVKDPPVTAAEGQCFLLIKPGLKIFFIRDWRGRLRGVSRLVVKVVEQRVVLARLVEVQRIDG